MFEFIKIKDQSDPKKKCDNYSFYYNNYTSFYKIFNYSESDMKNALGIIFFSDNLTFNKAIKEFDITGHCLWNLPKEIDGEEYEEITHQEVAVLKWYNHAVLFQVSGVRYNSNDREYLYSNTILLKKKNSISRIGYLTSNDCIEGNYIGY